MDIQWPLETRGETECLDGLIIRSHCWITNLIGKGGGCRVRGGAPYPWNRAIQLSGHMLSIVKRWYVSSRSIVAPCRCMDGQINEPYDMSMAWEPDRRSNFFSPPVHLVCAVTNTRVIQKVMQIRQYLNKKRIYSQIICFAASYYIAV